MLFDTKAGPLRLRWNDRGITAIEMPELSPRQLRAELLEQKDGAPGFVHDAARALKAHLAGAHQDLSKLPLDLSVLKPFQREVYEAVRALPPGRTATYGEIADKLGKPGASRAVGQALGRNPFLVAVPCHRVLAAGGAAGGFSAPGGVIAKQRLLALEGVTIAVDHGLSFDPLEAVTHLRERDRKLARLMDKCIAFRLRPAELQSTFEALAESILYQQLSGKAAATITARMIALFNPRPFPRPQDILEASPLDGGDAADLPSRPPRRPARDRLRRPQGLFETVGARGAAEAAGPARVRRALAPVSHRGFLVHVARARALVPAAGGRLGATLEPLLCRQ
ncbi:MAG: methylated-DNA--[protein]-cysteine S-methyltransferase [Myxococcales bacterium]|nr:methylated-DNA--[protein]-cysteine S-methyltransferase [Myxococcales bacterium]